MEEFDDYAWLIGREADRILRGCADDNRPLHQQIAGLRKTISADRARLVVQQVELRLRAGAKFGKLAGQLFFLPMQLQQATDIWIARYKAARLTGAEPLIDLCCGIGGDLLALAERGAVCGWDHDRSVALLAEANLDRHNATTAQARVRCEDVSRVVLDKNAAWHLDPDRRAAGRRYTHLESYQPSAAQIECWLRTSPSAAMKVAPAASVPESWARGCELEWISRGRECRQQVVWSGRFAGEPGMHRATLIQVDGEEGWTSESTVGSPGVVVEPSDTPAAVICEPDPSIVAAGLTGAVAEQWGMQPLGAGNILLTGDRAVDSPLASCFELVAKLPLRASDVAKFLRANKVGQLEIKVRGISIDPEKFRRLLKLRGNESAVLLLTRIGAQRIALAARRVAAADC